MSISDRKWGAVRLRAISKEEHSPNLVLMGEGSSEQHFSVFQPCICSQREQICSRQAFGRRFESIQLKERVA